MTRLSAAFVVALSLLVALAGLVGGAGAAPARVAANTVTYPDSTGEDALAPDITQVVVSNDDAGLIQFQISIPNRPTLSQDMILLIFIDTDANSATGDPDSLGADYAIQLVPGQVGLFRWDGTNFSSAGVSQSSLVFSYASGATIKVSANDLGATKRFAFGVLATSGIVVDASGNPDFANAHSDLAPDQGHGLFTYDVKVTPLSLVVKTLTTAPLKPKAGGSFTVNLVAARSDSGATIQGGTVTCTATVAFKPITARVQKVGGGKATCGYTIPKTAKGKTIRVTIVLQFEGLTVKRSVSAKIS